MQRKFPSSFYNNITFAGIGLALLSFGLILFLMLLEAMAAQQKPYMGIIAFVILPGFLIIGLALIALGAWRQHIRELRGQAVPFHFPTVDLNDPKHRRTAIVFSSGTILLLLFSAFGSYKAYEYTDSDQFCGTTCHSVMEPEYTAYQNSPHARVGCVQCHIGSGATWYVKSKFSGAYQIYATIFNKYPRPIPTPIQNLRPAQETCEQCHWPQHFFSSKHDTRTYYFTDEANSRWQLDLLLKVGGGTEESGPSSGIHWHMNIANIITYATPDSSRQSIPWFKVLHRDGTERIYKSADYSLTDAQFASLEQRRMDCIDCHNHPSHIYRHPMRSVDHVMSSGAIDTSLPYIKKISVETLERPYSTSDIARDSIRILIENYYKETYPAVATAKKASLDRAVAEVQKIYSLNYFPLMHVSWRHFPNNIGHMFSAGCFRCHDGKHVSDDGKTLTRDCNVCHTILAQQFGKERAQVSLTGLEYRHPVDIGDAWKETNCSDCHSAQ